MTTEAQRAANARNAAQSTGPKSEEGRSRSSANAIRHGAYAARIDPVVASILKEDPTELQQLYDAVIEDLDPETTLQESLARNVAARLVNVHRANRLVAPVAGSCELTDDEQFRIGPMRDEVTFGHRLLEAINVVEGSADARVQWVQVIMGLRQRIEEAGNHPLWHMWPDGGHRGPISDDEWKFKFNEIVDVAFENLGDARSYAESRVVLHRLSAEEETRHANGVEARRLLEGFERTSRLHERVDKGLARALETYRSLRHPKESE